MKHLIALIILLAFVMQTFSSAFVVADYLINTRSFAKNCVNKTKPALHCNGKCQMMKKIKEQEKREQEETERKAEKKSEVLSTGSFFANLPINFSMQIVSCYVLYKEGKQIKMPQSIFHPPSA